jgi:hypothetical protein
MAPSDPVRAVATDDLQHWRTARSLRAEPNERHARMRLEPFYWIDFIYPES